MSDAPLANNSPSALSLPNTGFYEWELITVEKYDDSDPIFAFNKGNGKKVPLINEVDGKPQHFLSKYVVNNIQIAYKVGKRQQDKLNVFMTPPTGERWVFSSGFDSYWSINMLAGLAGLGPNELTSNNLSFSNWRGTSRDRPAFVCVYHGRTSKKNQLLYAELKELKRIYTDSKKEDGQLLARVEQIVESLRSGIQGNTYYVDVLDEPIDNLNIID